MQIAHKICHSLLLYASLGIWSHIMHGSADMDMNYESQPIFPELFRPTDGQYSGAVFFPVLQALA